MAEEVDPCEFCGWTVGHDMECPCDVPALIEQWKRGYRDALMNWPKKFRKTWWRIRPTAGAREAYELGYRQGSEAYARTHSPKEPPKIDE